MKRKYEDLAKVAKLNGTASETTGKMCDGMTTQWETEIKVF